MSPYIVTTKRPDISAHWRRWFVSRCTVATLDDANRAIYEAQRSADPNAGTAIALNAFAVTATGGTVGPLPDGTLIEVEKAPDNRLASRAGVS